MNEFRLFAHGVEFDPDAYLASSPLKFDGVWRKGMGPSALLMWRCLVIGISPTYYVTLDREREWACESDAEPGAGDERQRSLSKLGELRMRIRQATLADVPVLVLLNRCVQDMHAEALPERFRRDAPDHVVARAFGEMIEAPSAYWILAEEVEPIAFLSAEFRDREETWCSVSHRVCYLGGIVVAPSFLRRGIARALVAALQQEAQVRGVPRIELDVWAFNEQAKQAFMKLGFQSVTERMTLSAARPNESAPPMPGSVTPPADE